MSDYKLNVQGWVEDVKPSVTKKQYEHATYTYYNYRSGKRSFRLITVEIDNGDVMYFAENHVTSEANRVSLRITAKDGNPQEIYSFLPGKPSAWQKLTEMPDSLNAPTYAEGEKLSYRIGKTEVYRPLGHTVFEEMPYYSPNVTVRKKSKDMEYEAVLPADSTSMSTNWGILSGPPLINWSEQKAYKKALDIEFDQDKKLRGDGAYTMIPKNYEPATETAFYRNPSNGEGLRANEFVSQPSMGKLFTDISTHLAYTAVAAQNEEGYWPTYPRSKWLNKEYRIGYAYMDNRRNADNATFLLRYLQQKPDSAVRQALNKWDSYLLRYIDRYNQQVDGRTISFIPDYVGHEGSRRTHTSLNHLAANMNYLLEAYLYDRDPAKKKAAEKLYAALEVTNQKWIRPDSNFYYALTPSFSPYPAEDYYKLTRDDLLHSQTLLVLLHGQRSKTLQYLIEQKEKWINAHPAPEVKFPEIKTP
ncbi:hypothetical protein ADA01nite_06530 [Aneurinibacillus danicus]|jgi:hypothetical protein|uniref:D-glucuronyl C5-epimerase C-terminal domain-containing protein n=2 Tax=Aneurinibacillus danicus TaxID=267746 RepID=A0A511V637_9BACL|nr:hypothetical protein ADA01nite_06530 [Aneurinibacillus danicus]